MSAQVSLGGETFAVAAPAPAKPFSAEDVVRPDAPPAPAMETEMTRIRLVDIAWARSGDKGDAFNIGVIARRPEYLPWIRKALTPQAVMTFFAHEFEGAASPRVDLYDLPGLNAINLHCLQSLGGGQFASLRLDPLAKGKAQQLLDLELEVPTRLAPALH